MPSTYSLFFACLTVALVALITFVVISLIFDRSDKIGLRAFFSPLALEVATIIATTSMVGSLIFSEVANFIPCRLCWIQRGFMYPAAVLLLFETFRQPRLFKSIKRPWFAYSASLLALIGLPVSIYHRIDQESELTSSSCDPAAPCNFKWANHFGFMTIPTMAGIGFLGIIFFVAWHHLNLRKNSAE